MKRIAHDPRFTISGLLLFLLLSSTASQAYGQIQEAPSGVTTELVGGVSVALDADAVRYEPGLRVGGTVGYELELDLPWRTTLRPQFTILWNNWRFVSPLNEGDHSMLLAMVGIAYTHYRPFKVRDVSVWTSLDFGLGSSMIEFDGFLGTNAMTEAHSGLAFRFQTGTAYDVLPYLSLGLYLELTNVGLEELTDLGFSAMSFDTGLVVKGRLPF